MFWNLAEARNVQERVSTSAADAENLALGFPGVPAGKVWCVLSASYMPTVNEAQLCGWTKATRSGATAALLNPITLTLNPHRFTFLEQGMELLLFPGEYLGVRRGGHTAGSSMTAFMQFIEIDLPLYTYDEPQIVKRHVSALSSIRTRIAGGGGAAGGGGVVPPGGGPGGGGGGGPLPV